MDPRIDLALLHMHFINSGGKMRASFECASFPNGESWVRLHIANRGERISSIRTYRVLPETELVGYYVTSNF